MTFNSERCRAKRSELAVESLLLLSQMGTHNNAYLASYVELITMKNRPDPPRLHYRHCCTRLLTNFFSFSKLLVVVLGPVSVEELVSVEDAPSDRFARYGI